MMPQEGELSPVTFMWQSKDSDIRVGYVSIRGRISILELVARLKDIAPGVDARDIDVNFATVRWTRRAFPDELERREEQRRQTDVRRERWERETYERLRAKYETQQHMEDWLDGRVSHVDEDDD